MLFEETMMKRHYDVDRQLVFATPLSNSIRSCDDIRVDWATIGRFSDINVLQRAEFVTNKLLPQNNHSAFFNNPPPPNSSAYLCGPLTNRFESFGPLRADTRALHFDHWH